MMSPTDIAVPFRVLTVTVGVLMSVILSLLLIPVSLAAARLSVFVARLLGGVVSIVTAKLDEAALVLPAASVALAVMLWVPSASVEVVMLKLPPVAVPVPTATPSL
jgi:hypothetical protein